MAVTKMNSNDNQLYVVQCTKDNLEDVHCMLVMSSRVVDVDFVNHCIKTPSLDNLTKRRLSDAGASFWQETNCVIASQAVPARRRV